MKTKNIKLLFIIFLIIAPFLISFQLVFAQEIQPKYIHLTWQHDPTTTMTVSWKTEDSTSSIVQYGADYTYGNEETGDSGVWHHVELIGLIPETIYHYRVGNGEIWSEDSTFKTGTSGNHTRFITLGDTQSGIAARNMMLKKINALDIDFALYSGDFVEVGSNLDEWNSFLKSYEVFTNHVPMMTTMGNHEKNHSIYYDTFALPGNEEYYSFNYGPIHFSVLHTYWEGAPDENYTKQANWLINDLEAHQDYDWNIVMMHRPPFSSFIRYHQGWYDLINESFVPIFELYDVDLVLTGHEHAYERLYKNNVTYIISGGAGANLYNVIPTYIIDESVYAESTYNFLFLEVYDNQLDVRGFRPDYSLIDQFTVNKNNKPDLRCENLPLTTTYFWKDEIYLNITIANNGESDITEEITGRVDISNGESWEFPIPPLDAHESMFLQYGWKIKKEGYYTWTVSVDIENQIDELIEENNVQEFTLNPSKDVEGSSFFAEGIWGFIAILSTTMLIAVMRMKRKK